MTERLVTFGCSHTFGHGLKDCIDLKNNYPLDNPSKYAWPSLLGQKLNLDVQNLSQPGSSAKQIVHTVFESDLDSNDLVIVLWPHHHRTCFYHDKNTYMRLGPWMKEAEYYYSNYYFEYDSLFEYYQKINLTDYYLKRKIKTCYHYIFQQTEDLFEWNTADIGKIYFSDIREKNPLALDNLHPGHEAHEKFAEMLYIERFE